MKQMNFAGPGGPRGGPGGPGGRGPGGPGGPGGRGPRGRGPGGFGGPRGGGHGFPPPPPPPPRRGYGPKRPGGCLGCCTLVVGAFMSIGVLMAMLISMLF